LSFRLILSAKNKVTAMKLTLFLGSTVSVNELVDNGE
jgi:hypothetical protein